MDEKLLLCSLFIAFFVVYISFEFNMRRSTFVCAFIIHLKKFSVLYLSNLQRVQGQISVTIRTTKYG